MPEWVTTLFVCLGFFTLLLITNLVIAFQAAMAGGGSPRRWYQLFLATHEALWCIATRTRTTSFAFMLAIVAIGFLIYLIGKSYDDAAFSILLGAWLLFVLGFTVTRWPR